MNKVISTILTISSLAALALPAIAAKPPVAAAKTPAAKAAFKTKKVSKRPINKVNTVAVVKKAK